MSTKIKTAIYPTRSENYPKWYQEVIKVSGLAENSVVRGCMIIKPWGYSLWENIKQPLDKMLKATGHENLYCPLFLPLNFLEKEADHIDGFAKECAVVTHHRLEADAQGKLKPAAALEEPLVVRPTSEALIGELFSRWLNSYRDLPMLYNQWANVVRWEMRPRLFLRTSEFLWQEGHTVHATRDEAVIETLKMLDVYVDLVQNYLAIPVIKGEKTESERFPGADNTYCIEAMMQDKKALQAGTSHFLGQNFAKAFAIKFLNKEKELVHAWTTSWGVSTRLIGGLIMTHSDDNGLVLPPRIAPLHIVIIPLLHDDKLRESILTYCDNIYNSLVSLFFHGSELRVKVDLKDGRAGDKKWQWIKKGVPIILEIGKRELENNKVFMSRRDQAVQDKHAVAASEFFEKVVEYLDTMQNNLFQKAHRFQQDNTKELNTKEELYDFFSNNDDNIDQGFAVIPWCQDAQSEKQLKQDLQITARCIPEDYVHKKGKCIFTGKQAPYVIFARAY